jgi:NADH-quinone oxidoreductase subunit H
MAFFDTGLGVFLLILAQCLLVSSVILVSLAFLMYADRKVWAAVQLRRGPNVVGPWGLLQSFADFLKYVVKEIVVPAGADKTLFFIAPMVSFVLPVVAWVVIPWNQGWVISDMNVGILFIFAISSMHVYAIIIGGWASNSKYPFLGALRSAAQMISYEVSIGLIIIGVLISTGSLNLSRIVMAQEGNWGLFNWYWLPHLPMVFLFFVSALAETNRPPFDLPEAEAELVAGYQVEYSSTPFLLFMIGELMSVFFMCAIMTLLFFGGWLSPFPIIPDGALWMFLKMTLIFFVIAMIKALVPRYRYDQLMRIGWKVFLPLSLGWVVWWGSSRSTDGSGALTSAGPWEADMAVSFGRRAKYFLLADFFAGFGLGPEVPLQAQGDAELPPREGPPVAPPPRRARAAPLRQRRGAVHRLQALRGGLPRAVHRHRRRTPRGRLAPHHALRHRHDEVHLLRPVPGGLPGGRHRAGAELRVHHGDARGAVLQQGEAARERRPLGGGDRPQPGARRPLPLRTRRWASPTSPSTSSPLWRWSRGSWWSPRAAPYIPSFG